MRLTLALIVLIFVGCDFSPSGPTSANTPHEMFTYIIESPVPPTVANLQGAGDTWQGYSVYLRFEALDADIDRIIASGFRTATWSDIAWRFNLPKGYDRFSPPWSPAAISTKECCEADVTNKWTHAGTPYLVVD